MNGLDLKKTTRYPFHATANGPDIMSWIVNIAFPTCAAAPTLQKLEMSITGLESTEPFCLELEEDWRELDYRLASRECLT